MNVQKFIGATSREALQLVRVALGPDALILSNRPVPNAGGVEIVAMSAKEMGNLATVEAPRNGSPAARRPEPATAGSTAQRVEAFRPPRVEAEKVSGGQGRAELAAREDAKPPVRRDEHLHADADIHQDGAAVMAELKAMRGMIETQLATIAWSESVRRSPLRMKFTRMLLSAGFGPALARSALARLPDDYTEEQGAKWLASVIARNIPVMTPEANLVSQGGVYAIVGPTGVGKTTTTAKLAARCVVRFGAEKIALVTTDSYRIGAQDQLRTYGRILGVPVHVVQDESGLASIIASLRGKHLILIDTVGMGQRDSRVIEQVSMLANSGANRILVLNATAHPETLEDVVHAFQGKALAGCIVSKSDEAVCMGGVLDTVLRHRLPLHFIASGQRVPEDLYEPNAQHLVQQALKAVAPKQPFRLSDDEFSLVMAPGEVPAAELKGATHA